MEYFPVDFTLSRANSKNWSPCILSPPQIKPTPMPTAAVKDRRAGKIECSLECILEEIKLLCSILNLNLCELAAQPVVQVRKFLG